jgi:hypothetical protein
VNLGSPKSQSTGYRHTARLARAIRKRRSDPNASEKPGAVLIAKPQKAQPTVDSELAIVLPGIFEIQNRGKGCTSFNFTSPIDDSTFSFPSFKEARKARESMRGAFEQLAVYENTQTNPRQRRSASGHHEGDAAYVKVRIDTEQAWSFRSVSLRGLDLGVPSDPSRHGCSWSLRNPEAGSFGRRPI